MPCFRIHITCPVLILDAPLFNNVIVTNIGNHSSWKIPSILINKEETLYRLTWVISFCFTFSNGVRVQTFVAVLACEASLFVPAQASSFLFLLLVNRLSTTSALWSSSELNVMKTSVRNELLR